ncbi:MAG TPA: glycoside hydrolase family 2 TIM barrel-domain containing protein, partial [Solirubrobacteraceae bacterium]
MDRGTRVKARTVASLAVALVIALGLATGARAQGPAYSPQAPAKGALTRDGQDGRYLLAGNWLYRQDLGDVGQAQGWWRNVASTDGWSPVTIPNSYNANDLSTTSMNGYVGWYRKDFTVPTGAFARSVKPRDRHWILRFENVNYQATVWLNGHKLGTHAGAYLPFEYDLKLKPGVNRLIVRVDDRRTPSALPPGPGGGWWNYGGILGEVYLRAVQRADISHAQIRPVLSCVTCAATIEDKAVVRNVTGSSQTVVLRGTYGRTKLDFGEHTLPPHASWTATATAKLAHPTLWAPGNPKLYKATLTLADAKGHRLGGYVDYSGVRKITVTSDGRLELNGRLLNLRGVNLHEQALGSGAALSLAQYQRLMGWVVELGATVVRAHYPLDPEFEELADRDGVLLWSEIPVWRVSNRYLNQRAWVTRAHAALADNIATNQNHPSILLWSIGNELPTPVSSQEASYIRGATALAHRLDPTRPVGMAVSDWPGVACQPSYAPLDVIGVNEYFGWFDAGGGTTDDRDSLSPFLDSFRACYSTKAIFVTEFGFDANRDGPVEERGTYAFQSNSLAFHLAVFASKPWLSGVTYFAMQDFAARPGWAGGNPWGTPPWVQKGMVDMYGNHRP